MTYETLLAVLGAAVTTGAPPHSLRGGTRTGAKQRRHTLALGIERIGLVSLRIPLAVAVVAAALAIAAGFGVARLKVDDSLSQLFRSDTPEF
ncbi:MAG: hypothetical protein ACREDM_11630, partial [Methylocella sp.]